MNFRQKLYDFMLGRYGFDEFGRFLFLTGLVTWAVSLVLRIVCRFMPVFTYLYMFVSALNTIAYVYAVFRILSRNIEKRQNENIRYFAVRDRVFNLRDRIRYRPVKEPADAQHIFRKCPHCGTKLRLKRLRGKHTTVCPKCGTAFKVRVWR